MSRQYRAWELKCELLKEFATLPNDKGKGNLFIHNRITNLNRILQTEKSKKNKEVIKKIIEICEKVREK